jgi:hypothetical protein
MQEEIVKNSMIAEHWKKIESIVKHDEKLLKPKKFLKPNNKRTY